MTDVCVSLLLLLILAQECCLLPVGLQELRHERGVTLYVLNHDGRLAIVLLDLDTLLFI